MRVLIVGGTRFIGPAVIDELRRRGHAMAVFHRGKTESDELPGVVHIHGERSNIVGHIAEIDRFAPDAVLDMAAMSQADVHPVVEVMRTRVRRAIVISSADVYRAYGRLHGTEPGPIEPTPITEDAPLRERRYPYRGERSGRLDDYDKILVEEAFCASRELSTTVVRLSAVYGERDYQHRLFMELARMDAGRPAILLPQGSMRWRWSRAYVRDAAHAICLAVTDERAAGRVYNVAEVQALTQEEWTRMIAGAVGWRGDILAVPDNHLPSHLDARINYAQDMSVDSTRIRAELGYTEQTTRSEALRHAIEWERANRPNVENNRLLNYEAEDDALAATREPAS